MPVTLTTSFRDLLEQVGARPARYGRKWFCPHCPDRKPPTLSIAWQEEVFFCHRDKCGWKGNRKTLERDRGVPVAQPSPAERREWQRINSEAERVEAWWDWRYSFLRDLNWLLGDIERLAAEGGREALARGKKVPERVSASLDFSIVERRKIWPELIFLVDTERNGSAITQRYRESRTA